MEAAALWVLQTKTWKVNEVHQKDLVRLWVYKEVNSRYLASVLHNLSNGRHKEGELGGSRVLLFFIYRLHVKPDETSHFLDNNLAIVMHCQKPTWLNWAELHWLSWVGLNDRNVDLAGQLESEAFFFQISLPVVKKTGQEW